MVRDLSGYITPVRDNSGYIAFLRYTLAIVVAAKLPFYANILKLILCNMVREFSGYDPSCEGL